MLMSVSLFGILLSTLCRYYSDPRANQGGELLQLDRAIGYMHKNYMRPVRRRELADLASMSESCFYRNFIKSVGKSPTEYLMDLRLIHAEKLLLAKNWGISEIAATCGFSDGNYLGLLFKKHYGITPHQYRVRMRKVI